jgi:hypothetical protein
MKQHFGILIAVIFIALSAFGQTHVDDFKCNPANLAGTGYDCAGIDLLIATDSAMDIRTWPGPRSDRFNSQKAFLDWNRWANLVGADIRSHNMASYRWHIVRLALRGPVKVSDAVRLVRLSFTVSRQKVSEPHQTVRELPSIDSAGITPCNAQEYRKAVAAGSSTEYDLAATLLERPCALPAHATRDDALLFWGRANQLLFSIDVSQWSPWYSNRPHTAHELAIHDAVTRETITLRLLKQWETTGQPPAQWREQLEAFAVSVDKANTGPGRVVVDGDRWVAVSAGGGSTQSR